MKIDSFDIFDTCLQRACGSEYALFDILASYILGDSADIMAKIEFTRIRIQAEKTAHKLIKEEEITTYEIYKYCDFTPLTSIVNDSIIATELSLLKELLIPVLSIKEKIELQRNKGSLIIFISDMHLPQIFLQQVLVNKGLFQEGDLIYLSSEYRKTKHSGTLFQKVKADILNRGFIINRWDHYGDSVNSDYKVPRKQGIHSHLVKQKQTFYQRILSEPIIPINLLHDCFANISKSLFYSINSSFIGYSTDLIAPMFVPFVYGILEKAQKKDINHLYFFARDGYILYRIALCFTQLFPNVQLHYLYLSRRVLYLPSLEKIELESFLQLKTIKNLSITDYFDQFGIDVDYLDLVGCQDYMNKATLPQTQKEVLLKKILEKQDNIYQIKKQQQNAIIVLLSYFRQEGFARTNETVAMVDMTGSRSSQQAINMLFRREGIPEIFAFYFLVAEDRKSIMEAGNFDACILPDRMKVHPYCYLGDLALLFESLYSITNQNRTIDYQNNRGRIEPVFDSFKISDFRSDLMQSNLMALEAYSNLYIKTKSYLNNQLLLNRGIYVNSLFAFNPKYSYVKKLKGFFFEENMSSRVPIIANPYSKKEFIWFRGSIISMSPIMNKIINLLHLIKKYKHG